MYPFHRWLAPMAALLCLAALLIACGDQTQELAPAAGGQTLIETKPAAPAAVPIELEPISPSLPGQSPLPAPTSAPEIEVDRPPLGPAKVEITPPATAPLAGEVPQKLLDAVLADLAEQQGISREAIKIEQAGAVTWRDRSLGCPQPGRMYAMALVAGYQIVLRVDDKIYDYHAGAREDFLLCPPEMAEDPLPQPTRTDDSRLPIFVEMVKTPLSPDLSSQMPPANTTPGGVYVYNPADRSLLVAPDIEITPTTEVLVGLSSTNVPGKPYLARDLFQIPSAQPAPLRVVAVDAACGTLTLAYADETFELGPGQSQSFKLKGPEDLAPLDLATITNYGCLTAIGLLPPDPGSR